MRDERDMVLGCGWLLQMAGYGAGLRLLGSTMERQGREMRDRGEGVKDERQNRGERVRLNIYIYIYNTCYNAILCLELHCSSIAKKFAILMFSILQYRWF